MSNQDLKEREENSIGNKWDEKFHSPHKNSDPLEDTYNAPSAGDEDLPSSHPDRGDTSTPTPEKIKSAETSGGGLWSGEDKTSKPKNKKSKRRQWLAGGITTLTVGAIGIIFSIISGPLEFLQLDFGLGRFDRQSHLVKKSRMNNGFTRMARAYATGDAGETRVGYMGSRIFHNVNDRLASEHGISFDRRESGRPTRALINPPSDSPLRGSDGGATRANISRQLGVPLSSVEPTAQGFVVSTEGMNQSQLRRFIGNVVQLDNVSRNQTRASTVFSLRYRTIAKFWNAPSLFHPIQRTAASAQESMNVQSQRRLERERKNRDGRSVQLASKYANAKSTLRNRIGANNLARANVALTFTGGLCLLGEIADIIPDLNYGVVVQPAMEEAIDKKAVAAQSQSGDDLTKHQLGAIKESLTDDEGRTIHSSKPMNALINGGEGRGAEADPALKQAFSMRGSSLEILSETLFEDEPQLQNLASQGDNFRDIACSPLGYGVQIVAGGALTILGPGGAAIKTVQTAGSMAVSAMIINWAASFMSDELEEKAADMCGFVDEGEEGGYRMENAEKFGSCMAYGSRGAHNMTATSMGGVELDEQQERQLAMELIEEERTMLMNENFATRMFSTDNPHSLLANLAREHNFRFDPGNNFTNIASSLLKVPRFAFSSITSLFTKNAGAEPVNYDWGFPLVGIPLEIINNPKYEDPYENAAKVEELHNSGGMQAYEDRIEACFGVEIRESNGLLVAVPVEEVVPMDDSYVEADCNDLSDENWVRIMLFIYDDAIITSIDCYEGGVSSCRDLGINQ